MANKPDDRSAGWKPDPKDPALERYWRGSYWSEIRRPKGSNLELADKLQTPQRTQIEVDPEEADSSLTAARQSSDSTFNQIVGGVKRALPNTWSRIVAGVIAVILVVLISDALTSNNWESMCRTSAEKGFAELGWAPGSSDHKEMVRGATEICVMRVNDLKDEGLWSDEEIKAKVGIRE